MRRTVLVAAAMALMVAPGAVHADDGDGIVRFGRSHWLVGAAASAAPNDHLHAEGYHTAFYYQCNPGTPPECWLVSKLNFWISLDLGYRRHEFQGRTSIGFGALTWSQWTNKRHTMRCVVGSNYCGVVRKVPTGRWWSDKHTYRTTRFPNPGRFRFRATACAVGVFTACGVGRTVSPLIRCSAAEQQCEFVDD